MANWGNLSCTIKETSSLGFQTLVQSFDFIWKPKNLTQRLNSWPHVLKQNSTKFLN